MPIQFPFHSNATRQSLQAHQFVTGEKLTIYRFYERPNPFAFMGEPVWPVAVMLLLADGTWAWREPSAVFWDKEAEPQFDPTHPEGYDDWRKGHFWPGVLRRIEPAEMIAAMEYWLDRANGVNVAVTREDIEVPADAAGLSAWRFLSHLGTEMGRVQAERWEVLGELGIDTEI